MKEDSNFKSRFFEYSPIFISQMLLALFVVFDYTFTDNLNHELGSLFYVIIAVTAALIVLPLFKFYIYFTQRYIIVFLHYLAVTLFLIFFAPIDGAYYFLLFFYITVSMYWYGWKGYFAGLGAIIFITIAATLVQFPHPDSMIIYHVGSHFTILFISSLYIALLMLRKPISADARFLRNSATFEHTRLVSLINSMADAVIGTNEKGTITLYNGAALGLLNTNTEIEDKNISEVLFLKDEHNEAVDLLKQSRKENKMISRDDLHFTSNENSDVYVSINISPVRSAPGRQGEEGYIIVVRDITKQKNLDEERNEFISVASHELRTPIATAEANIATAMRPRNGQLPEESLKQLDHAHNNVIFLADLINDLTTLDRAEHNKLDISVKLVDPNKLITEIAQNYQNQAKQAGLVLQASTTDDVNSLLSSELYIKEILQNFVSNSLKYTKQGVIILRAREGKNGSVVFSVSDTGIGISSTDKNKIFSKFYRSEDYRTRQTRGTGLGLYITLKLAKRINGKIWFESQLNKGSTFYLEVPTVGALSQDQQKVAKEEIKDFASSV